MRPVLSVLTLWFAFAFSCGCGDDPAPISDADLDSGGSDGADLSNQLDGAGDADDLDDSTDSVEVDQTADRSDLTDAEPDAGRCSAPPTQAPSPSGPLPGVSSPHSGIDPLELEAYSTLRDAVLADTGVHFVATYDQQSGHYLIESGPLEDRQVLRFRRLTSEAGGVEYEVTEGDIDDIFPSTANDIYGSYDELLSDFENPGNVQFTELGYEADDPRVGYLPPGDQSYPLPLVRIAALFDAPSAPDAVSSLYPWARPARGTHGSMSLLQSRSTLIFSGAGVRSDTVVEDSVLLADVAPTVLAALGAPTTGGIGPDGTYDDGLYLSRQDGTVLWQALSADPCDRPSQVVIMLFDGLMATEINYLVAHDEAGLQLPSFRELAEDAAIFQYGAVANFPSVSAPGHMTAATGLWSGHHNFIANDLFDRESQTVVSPSSLLADPAHFLEHPEEVLALYDDVVAPGVETIGQAAQRALGAYDPDTGEGAFVAVINDIGMIDADFSSIDFAVGEKGLAEYRMADEVAVFQVENLLRDETVPVPTVLQVSFLATDGAGESAGPHSPLLRSELEQTDRRVGAILNAYEARDALDDTLFVLLSDHGMELQDPSRASAIRNALSGSGVVLSHLASGNIYFRTLEIEARLDDGEGPQLRVEVRNHDNDGPIEGAAVSCDYCSDVLAETNSEGIAVLSLAGDETAAVVSATHPDFNPQHYNWTATSE